MNHKASTAKPPVLMPGKILISRTGLGGVEAVVAVPPMAGEKGKRRSGSKSKQVTKGDRK